MSDSTTSPAYVYVIQAKSGPVKIGVTIDTTQRLAAHQTSNHELLVLLCSFEYPSIEQAVQVEQALKKRYASQNIRGEWYAVDPDNIISDVEFFSVLCKAIAGVTVEYIPVAHKPSKTPAKPRVKIREVAKQVRENGDEGLSTAEMMEKYGIGLGSTSKVRSILAANGRGNNTGE